MTEDKEALFCLVAKFSRVRGRYMSVDGCIITSEGKRQTDALNEDAKTEKFAAAVRCFMEHIVTCKGKKQTYSMTQDEDKHNDK